MADDLISTDHGSNNIPHCKQAICCNISLRTWGIAWFEYAHIPASQLSPLGNTHLPPSCKLNVAERHLQLPAFQLGAPARREQQSHAQALASDRGGKKKAELEVTNPSLQHHSLQLLWRWGHRVTTSLKPKTKAKR